MFQTPQRLRPRAKMSDGVVPSTSVDARHSVGQTSHRVSAASRNEVSSGMRKAGCSGSVFNLPAFSDAGLTRSRASELTARDSHSHSVHPGQVGRAPNLVHGLHCEWKNGVALGIPLSVRQMTRGEVSLAIDTNELSRSHTSKLSEEKQNKNCRSASSRHAFAQRHTVLPSDSKAGLSSASGLCV